MIQSLVSLSEFFGRHAARNEPLVLATVAQTIGSTYRKAGAQMLIAADGDAAGLLSGGCLETDLIERARNVLATGEPVSVTYDTRSSDDLLWGIGLGCEGAMTIVMTRLDRAHGYQPFAFIDQCRREDVPNSVALVTATRTSAHRLGQSYVSEESPGLPSAVVRAMRLARTDARASATSIDANEATFLVIPVQRPLRLLVLGAGPDAMPLVEIAGLMGWHVTVLDHRPAYAVAARFPRAKRVAVNPAMDIARELRTARYDAAVVMSHHLPSDQAYLAALADETRIAYVGLLGPAPRRARLLQEIGAKSAALAGRLRGPVGLDIGANTPETIALAIVAEVQAVMTGRDGGSFS